MIRIGTLLVAATLVAGLQAASAQTSAAPEAKPSRVKLTMEKLKEMKATWVANRPKMRACRAEVKAKGLTGDDRWFYMEDCMSKT
ncbi:hypothetical protein UP09_06260 [Bradyrhizobium sp. LTSP885]|uniref:PsiF family protein n=1 Tax=Bradyrhizobium sp. LTSP885 TaxID=1619232 RepID=UPI0005C934E6|nr:PsiF family protein [Bradyrhizobium sp. LTSP885]KJC49700.1 hypothetical protein UP09_06260 [Bradyrhizobium sp. LTSP885]